MEAAERRRNMMRVLCRRRHDTVPNLAKEFGVSERTILRDIQALSITEPIYTQSGRYGGGIYVMKNYTMDRMYMTDIELAVLNKVLACLERDTQYELDDTDKKVLKSIILQYTKPSLGKDNIYEKSRKESI